LDYRNAYDIFNNQLECDVIHDSASEKIYDLKHGRMDDLEFARRSVPIIQ
jgi:hypothetical protein